MISILLFWGNFIILCNRARGNGQPCKVDYKTISENVPYCGGSTWLHWDCLNKCTGISTQMNNITRLRVLCCSGGRDCFEECHHPKDYDKDTQYCGNVCPPFFTPSPPLPVRATPRPTKPSTKPAPSSINTTHKLVVTRGNVVGPGTGITNATKFSALLPTLSKQSSSKTTSTLPIVSTSQLQNVVANVDTTQTLSATATTQQAPAVSTTMSTPSSSKTTTTTSILSTRQYQNVVANVDTTQTLSTTATTQQKPAISTVKAETSTSQAGTIQLNAHGLETPTVLTTLAPSGQTNSISSQNSDSVVDKTCPLGPWWKLHDNYDLPGK